MVTFLPRMYRNIDVLPWVQLSISHPNVTGLVYINFLLPPRTAVPPRVGISF